MTATASRWTPSATSTLQGFTDSSDFPTTAGAFQTTYGGGDDAFVAQFSATDPLRLLRPNSNCPPHRLLRLPLRPQLPLRPHPLLPLLPLLLLPRLRLLRHRLPLPLAPQRPPLADPNADTAVSDRGRGRKAPRQPRPICGEALLDWGDVARGQDPAQSTEGCDRDHGTKPLYRQHHEARNLHLLSDRQGRQLFEPGHGDLPVE